LNSVIDSWYTSNAADDGVLGKFITKAGTTWSSSMFESFYLASSPKNNGFVSCNGVSTEAYNGLTAGYALNEFTGIGLNTCAENCIAHSPSNPVACAKGAVCPYTNLCTGFYFWN